MAWTASKIFSNYLHDVLTNISAADLDTDALFEAALFDNTLTPNQTDTTAHNAYGAAGGQWAAGGVVDTGTGAPAGWPALGRPLGTIAVSAATVALFAFGAANTVSASTTTTLTNATGCLIYDHSAGTPTDEGVCFNYFGGVNTVTLGQFTIAWTGGNVFTIQL